MIFRALFLLCFSFSVTAADNDINFALAEVKYSDLARIVVDDVGGQSLILSPEVLADDRKVAYFHKSTTKAAALHQFKLLSSSLGYSVIDRAGVLFIAPSQVETDYFVYRPKSRTVTQINDVLNGLLPGFRPMTSRSVALPSAAAANPAPSFGSPVIDKPNSALSLVSKGDAQVLIAQVPKDQLALVSRLVEELDQPSPEVVVKALLVEVQASVVESSAVNLLLSILGGKIGIEWTGGGDQKRGISIKTGAVDALWSAIETDRRFKVLSSPRLRVLSGSSARFSVGSEVPVLGSVSYTQTGQPVQSVEYKPAGVILDLSPVVRSGRAEIQIKQQLSNFVQTTSGVNNSPTLLKRELQTVLTASAGDVVMLAGLDESKTVSDSAGLLFMPSWMRSKSADDLQTSIVMLLHVESIN